MISSLQLARCAYTYATQCTYQFNRSAFGSSNPEKIPNRKFPFLENNTGCFQLFWRDIFTIFLAPGRASNDFHFINQKYYVIISRAKACGGCTISISGIAITEIRNDVGGKRISRGNFIQQIVCFYQESKAMKSSSLLGPFCGSEFWGFSLLKI